MSDLLDPPPEPSASAGEGNGNSAWEPSQLERLARRFLAEGDEEVLEQLCARAWKSVRRVLRRLGIPEKDVDDSTQNVLFRVCEQIGSWRIEAPFEGWLKTIVLNEWKNQHRYWQVQKRKGEERSIDSGAGQEGDAGVDLVAWEEDPLMTTLAREKRALLEQAIERLPPKMGQCLKLRLLRELKYREIAVVLRLSEATVKSHLREGVPRLGPLLQEHAEVFDPQREPP